MTKCNFVPKGWRVIVDELVRSGDFYWNRKDWLPVLDGMINYKIKYEVIRRKHAQA